MFAAILVFAALRVFAQSSGGGVPDQSLIKLNVVASTAKGEPVTDLQASDIRIKEDGKARPVALFRLAGGANSADPTIVIVDRWNEKVATLASTWSEIQEGLRTVQPGDPVYLYYLDNHGALIPVRPLPRADASRAALELSYSQLIDGLDDVMKMSPGFRGADAWDPVQRANLTFRALNSLSAQVAGLAGRKNLLWVTHGIPLMANVPSGGMADFTQRIRDFAATAGQAQIAVYAVDESFAGAGADPFGQSHAALEMLTKLTGGRWFTSNSFKPAIAACLNDSRSNYTVAFYSPIAERRYHKLRVESARKGVRLLTRDGFDGVAAIGPGTGDSEEAAFSNEQESPIEATEIGVKVASVSLDSSTDVFHVELRINSKDLLMNRKNGNYEAHLVVMPALYSEGAFKKTLAPTTVDISLTEAQMDAAKEGIGVTRYLPAVSGVDKARIMVFDRGRHALGSVMVELPR